MSSSVDLERHRGWVVEGTETAAAAVDALSDEQLREPSILPGWSRAHVVAHIARNAQGLQRLATWALTGVETPMYPSVDFREMQIEETAEFTAAQLRELLASTAHDLEHRLDDLEAEDAWERPIRTFQGATIPVCQIVWLRVRETWIHTVDLGAGIIFDDLPADLQTELLDDVATGMAAREGMPAIAVLDGERMWRFGSPEEEAAEVTGSRPALLAWVLGRPAAARTPLSAPPALPRWV